MRKINKGWILLLACILVPFMALSVSGKDAGAAKANPNYTKASEADIPYSYEGENDHWAARCNIRRASSAEVADSVLMLDHSLTGLKNALDQGRLGQEEFQERSEVLKDQKAALEAEPVYISELIISYKEDPDLFASSHVSYELSLSDKSYVSASLSDLGGRAGGAPQSKHALLTGRQPWFYSVNASENFSTGAFLPKEKEYILSICYTNERGVSEREEIRLGIDRQ